MKASVAVATAILFLTVALHSQPSDPAREEVLLPDSAAIPLVEVHKGKPFPEKRAIVYAPISLAVGRIRTAEFPVEKRWYNIMIRVEKPLPFRDMQCMLGNTSILLTVQDCGEEYAILRADWTVWENGRMVHSGSSRTRSACRWEDDHICACIGDFEGDRNKTYVVQVHFTRDATALNNANPRLLIIKNTDIFTF